MSLQVKKRPTCVWIISMIALVFGIATIRSGGSVLFSEEAARAAGNSVYFVVWFNFLAGFVYLIAGAGFFFMQRWSFYISGLIALTTLAVFSAFVAYILTGEAYEIRTVGAMVLRSVLWVMLTVASFRIFIRVVHQELLPTNSRRS